MMIHDLEVATGSDFAGPLRPKALVQYMAGLCLAFTPGTSAVYSNFGYTLLGRVFEGLHGQVWSPGDGQDRHFGWGPYIDPPPWAQRGQSQPNVPAVSRP